MRWVLLAALAVRGFVPSCAFFVTGEKAVFSARDTPLYLELAEKLISSGSFSSHGEPELLRTPGYPIFLIPGICLGEVEIVTIALQILLSCLTVYLVFETGRLLCGRSRIALLCALLYAFEPLSVLYVGKLLTETAFTFLIALFFYLLIRYVKCGSPTALMLSSLPLAAAVYVRPIAYFLPLVSALLLLAGKRGRRARRYLLFFFLLSAVPIGAWQVRNSAVAGYPGFSAIAGVNLYFYQAASVLALRQGIPYREMQERMGYHDLEVYLDNHPEQRGWPRSERYRFMERKGLEILLDAPILYAVVHLKGMIRTLFDPGVVGYLKLFGLYPESGGMLGRIVDQGLVRALAGLYRKAPVAFWTSLAGEAGLALCLFFAASAWFTGYFPRDLSGLALLVLLLYFLLLSGGPQSLARFRHPMMPALCILAGCGAAGLLRKLRLEAAVLSGPRIP